jgi:hypothetical protein
MTLKRPAAVGFVLFGLHAIAYPGLLRSGRSDLRVQLDGDLVSPDGKLPFTAHATPARAKFSVEPLGPGLRRAEWDADYGGGFRQRAAVTIETGPFQAGPTCGVTLLVGQRFLDETLAPLAKIELEHALAGMGHWTIGDFQKVGSLQLRWKAGKTFGSLDVALELVFERAAIDLHIGVTPVLKSGHLVLFPDVDAGVKLGSKVLRAGAWVASKLGVFDKDDEAKGQVLSLVDQIAGSLQSLKLPSIELPGHAGTIPLEFCPTGQIHVEEGAYMAIPLAFDSPGAIHLASAGGPPPALDAPIAVDVDLDTVNLLLYRLWKGGVVDEALDEQAAQAFNLADDVQRFLSLRLGKVTVAAPPTVERGTTRLLALAAEAAVDLDDHGAHSAGRLFGRMDFDVGAEKGHMKLRLSADDVARDLAQSVVLTCEPQPHVFQPCFATIVEAALTEVRSRRADVHTWLTTQLENVLDQVVTDYAFDLPGDRKLRVHPRTVTAAPDGQSARLRADLDVTVE